MRRVHRLDQIADNNRPIRLIMQRTRAPRCKQIGRLFLPCRTSALSGSLPVDAPLGESVLDSSDPARWLPIITNIAGALGGGSSVSFRLTCVELVTFLPS